jgi:hypothetical protein
MVGSTPGRVGGLAYYGSERGPGAMQWVRDKGTWVKMKVLVGMLGGGCLVPWDDGLVMGFSVVRLVLEVSWLW